MDEKINKVLSFEDALLVANELIDHERNFTFWKPDLELYECGFTEKEVKATGKTGYTSFIKIDKADRVMIGNRLSKTWRQPVTEDEKDETQAHTLHWTADLKKSVVIHGIKYTVKKIKHGPDRIYGVGSILPSIPKELRNKG